jgi:hypothetical protein
MLIKEAYRIPKKAPRKAKSNAVNTFVSPYENELKVGRMERLT